MAFYDLEEQEQLSELQAWWKQWGAALLLGIVLVLGAVAAYQGWGWYKRDQAAKASELYAAMLKAESAGDPKQARETAAMLAERYPSVGYAPLAQLLSARLSFEAGDLAAAQQNLRWVIEHARDDDMKAIARYRLAGVLLDEKQYDEALGLLDVKPGHPMANLFADLRGDVYFAKGSEPEARAAYQSALEKTEVGSPYRNLIQIKIDALGQTQ
ncbi:MAG: tetratricopeptide repeat protein [Betaproteobacteria bacterium]|nr:tetratricopeptide repeat protein [Betaproteobacteria bacterium]